jgi:hypothetical protein
MCSHVPSKYRRASPTRASRWSGTLATTATSVGVNGRRQMRTNWCLPFCGPMNPPRGTARTGQGLPASGGLIEKIYEIDPLTGPKCHGPMAVIAFIEAEDVIEKILQRRTSPQTPRSMGAHAQACLRLPVAFATQTGARRTSCHEPRNRNREMPPGGWTPPFFAQKAVSQ